MPAVKKENQFSQTSAGLDLKDYHHVEIYVGNARQASHFYPLPIAVWKPGTATVLQLR
jgi:hypothetical protein